MHALTNLLFQTPWWLPTSLAGIGIFVLWTGNQRQEKPVIRTGLAIALAGLILAMVSYLVDTPQERAERRTRDVVAAASKHDWPTFHKLLDPQTAVYDLRGPDQITDAAKLAADRYNLGSLRITGLQSRVADTIVTITIRVLGEIQGQNALTDWQFEFQDRGKGWILYEVRAISNQQFSEKELRSHVTR